MNVQAFHNSLPYEEFDHQTLLDNLAEYANPRARITALLRSGAIIRVKKGLYVFGDDYRRRPLCRELLANLIYGPSYLSLEYALAWHGLIPERVETLTSVTCGRSRSFDTPLGMFSYRMLPLANYRVGMDRYAVADGRSFLMAIPEKALADQLMAGRGAALASQKQLTTYLADNLRIDESALQALSFERLETIAAACRSRRVLLLAQLVRRMKGRT